MRPRSARVPVGFYSDMVEADGTRHRCFVTCISASGLYFDSVSVPPALLGATVKLSLGLPTRPGPFEVLGQIVGEVDGHVFRETAVRFVSMAADDEKALRDWVNKRHVSVESSIHAA